MRYNQEKTFPVTSFFVIVCVLLASGAIIKGQTANPSLSLNVDSVKGEIVRINYPEKINSSEFVRSPELSGISKETFSQPIPSMILVGCSGLNSLSE